jgi:glycosyltransferase involved in cell wall biosynthesis
MKKIVHIIPKFSFGGAEIYLLDLLKNYDYQRHEVHVITISPNVPYFENELLNIKSLKYHTLNVTSLKRVTWLFAFYKKIKEINPDIIHAHLNLALLATVLFKKVFKSKIILTQHSVYKNDSLYYFFLKKMTSLFDLVLCNSEFTKLYVITNNFQKENKVHNYSLGLDFNRYKKDRLIRDKVLKQINIPSDRKIIGNIGSFKFHKGHTYLIDAFKMLLEKQNNIHLLLVGDGVLKKDIEKKVYSMGISDHVSFFSATNNVSDYFNVFDLYCSTSISESFGITLLESIYFQVPIVSFDTDAIPELVIEGRTGFLVESKNEKKLSNTLSNLLMDEKMCSRIKEHQLLFAKRYQIDHHLVKLMSLYDNILK